MYIREEGMHFSSPWPEPVKPWGIYGNCKEVYKPASPKMTLYFKEF